MDCGGTQARAQPRACARRRATPKPFPAHAVADDARALDVAFIKVVQQVFRHRFITITGGAGFDRDCADHEAHAVSALAQGQPIISAEQAAR